MKLLLAIGILFIASVFTLVCVKLSAPIPGEHWIKIGNSDTVIVLISDRGLIYSESLEDKKKYLLPIRQFKADFKYIQ